MKLVLRVRSPRRILRWIQGGLFALAVVALAYCGFVLLDTQYFQNAEGRQLERLLAQQSDGPKYSVPPVTGGLIGRVEIPRLGVAAIVMEGTNALTLRRAVGHITGTAFPGQPGNVGLSGHRDTFFRPLRHIRLNDVITLTTLLGEYRYRVISTKIVGPSNLAVLDPSGDQILTLVTCYPFYFVGSAPDRFIVRAERVI